MSAKNTPTDRHSVELSFRVGADGEAVLIADGEPVPSDTPISINAAQLARFGYAYLTVGELEGRKAVVKFVLEYIGDGGPLERWVAKRVREERAKAAGLPPVIDMRIVSQPDTVIAQMPQRVRNVVVKRDQGGQIIQTTDLAEDVA